MSVEDKVVLPPLPPLHINVQPASEIRGPPHAYKHETNPRGAVFIANYRQFHSSVRQGSEKDVQNFKDLFTQMGYTTVEVLIDAGKMETKRALERFRDQKILEEVDSLVVIFMSHGRKGDVFYTSDDEEMTCEEVIESFSNSLCPAVCGKPKLFMFQMCRGQREHIPVETKKDDKIIMNPLQRRKKCEREISDVFICFSSISGFVSYRQQHYGSHFVHYVCKIFMKHAKDKTLDSLMKQVNTEAPMPVACEKRELGTTKDFYFNPIGEELQKNENLKSLQLTGTDSRVDNEKTNKECCSSRSWTDAPPKMNYRYDLKEDEETYSRPLATKYQGTALIINNLQPNCSQDVEKLADVFSRLGYQIQGPFSNLTRDELLQKVSHLKELTEESSVIIVYYGKGLGDYLITSDNRAVAYQELFSTLNNDNCPNLSGRPKIFIFNICFYTGTVVEEEECVDDSESELATDAIQYRDVRAEQDIFILIVEVDGNCDGGSLLTEALYQVLQSSDGARELTPLMRTVSRRLHELQANGYTTETRALNFRKNFYFTSYKPTVTPPSTPVSLLVPAVLQRAHVIPQILNVVFSNKMKTCATEDAYLNRSTPRGLVLLISYDTYTSENLPNCYWRKADSQILSSLLEQCGYKVTLLKNLSMEDLLAALKHYKEREQHGILDSAMVVWLGLARDTNTMYTSEGQTFPLNQLYTCFTNTNCPALTGKPKFIFLHMTLLEENLKDTPSCTDEDLRDTFILRLVSRLKHTGSTGQVYGTHPSVGFMSLCKILANRAQDSHLEKIVSLAEEELLAGNPSNKDKLETFTRQYIAFSKNFYLNPKKGHK
ncbi:hypothetical protein Pmani_002016 [Petrolisthes manimaculis]|uniref:Uncharacterized protein n=1 Tax=Petrolisthes manimaculis TaxID=1843537 RepID=A0AAE1QJH7_9EUCA|nr:hypothetical protein Pmani_002016 [Petrolisthes manimaculis]